MPGGDGRWALAPSMKAVRVTSHLRLCFCLYIRLQWTRYFVAFSRGDVNSPLRNDRVSGKIRLLSFLRQLRQKSTNSDIFTVKFRNGSAEKLGFKLAPLLESVAALPCEKQVFNYKVVLFYFLCGYFLNLTVKNYLKCVHFCRSYRENKNDLLFSETPCSSFARVISLMWLFAIWIICF